MSQALYVNCTLICTSLTWVPVPSSRMGQETEAGKVEGLLWPVSREGGSQNSERRNPVLAGSKHVIWGSVLEPFNFI